MNLNIDDLNKENGYSYFDEIWEIPNKANTQYLTHGYFRYIGKFPPQIPRELIQQYSSPGMTILDPMCGGGTTLTEGRLAGCDVVGCDVNPVSLLVSEVVSKKLTNELLCKYRSKLMEELSYYDESTILYDKDKAQSIKVIKLGDNSKYFTEKALYNISVLMNYFDSIHDIDIKNFFLVALLGILRQVSRANVKKMNVTIDESKKIKDVFPTFMKKLNEMIIINSELKDSFSNTTLNLYQQDARNLTFEDNSFDMVIIHPPYLSNTAFSESTQLQLAILGVNHKNIWKNELKARGSYLHVTDGLRKYLVGWNLILKEAYRVLKPGGICAIENGDGQIDYVRIPIGPITKEFASDIGFSIEKHILHKINNNTGLTLTHKMKDHHIIVMRKGN